MYALHLAAECAPLAQAGGLADVVAALPAALRAEGIRASVALPLYGGPGGAMARQAGALDRVWTGDVGGFDATVWHAVDLDTPTFLVETPAFAAEGVYLDAVGEALPDARFVSFQRTVLAWLRAAPHDRPSVLHLHDHHAALVPALLTGDPANDVLSDLPTVLTVHSADHQGALLTNELVEAGIDPDLVAAMRSSADSDGVLNALRIGVSTADAVVVPSPTYAAELRGDGVAPRGLGRVFRTAREQTVGVLHGVDRAVWNPACDPHLPAPFTPDDLRGKRLAKDAVCRELGLDPGRPLLAFIGRLMPENGVEILFEAVERLLGRTEAGIAILGLGPPEQEARLRGLGALVRAQDAGERLAVRNAFDVPFAHRLVAGADVLLAPARTEPSARTAMIALAYGTVPVAHAVGALRDVVCPGDAPPRGVCFDGFGTTPFVEAVEGALDRLANADSWRALQHAGMTAAFSWQTTAQRIAGVYQDVSESGTRSVADSDRFLVR